MPKTPDLTWLDVSDQVLPNQNFDVLPDIDLFSAVHVDPHPVAPRYKGPTVDINLDNTRQIRVNQVLKVVRDQISQGRSARETAAWLVKNIDPDIVTALLDRIRPILSEEGLLGRFYALAEDVCDTSRTAKVPDVHFIVKKADCTGCIRNHSNVCSLLQKPLTDRCVYSEEKAAEVEQLTGRFGSGTPKERIRQALDLNTPLTEGRFISRPSGTAQVHLPVLKNDPSLSNPAPISSASPVAKFVACALMRKNDLREILAELKQNFSVDTLAGASDWRTLLAKETGILGFAYLDPEYLDVCSDSYRGGPLQAPFIRKASKCNSCLKARDSYCASFNVPFFDESDLPDVVQVQLQQQGVSASVVEGLSPRDSLRKLAALQAPLREERFVPKVVTGHLPSLPQLSEAPTEQEVQEVIVKVGSLLNEGLFGADLLNQLDHFSDDVLQAAEPTLSSLLKEQGLQGHTYLDPSVYQDYGFGCRFGAKRHKGSKATYLKYGSKCDSCTLATGAICSAYKKELIEVEDIVYPDGRLAAQQSVLVTGLQPQVDGPMESVLHAAFDLHRATPIELPAPTQKIQMNLKLGSNNFAL